MTRLTQAKSAISIRTNVRFSMSTSLSTPRDSEAKLQHILSISAQTFADHGFEGTSIRDISRATGVSLSGLYYYFESKQKLLYLIQNKGPAHFLPENESAALRTIFEPHFAEFGELFTSRPGR